MNNEAESVLSKEETIREIVKFLLENPRTQTGAIFATVKRILDQRGITGPQKIHQGGGILSYDARINSDDALLINECIYDLLYSRVITPGINADNLDLPFVHVSNPDKLRELL